MRTLFAGLHARENEGLVAAHYKRAHAVHLRMSLNDVSDRAVVLGHILKRDILRTHGHSEHESAVLTGNEPARHGREQVICSEQHRDGYRKGRHMESHCETERTLVGSRHQFEARFQDVVNEPVFAGVARLQEPAAEHWRES